MITVELKHRGSTGNSGGWKYDYIVTGTDADSEMSEFEAIAAVTGEAPESIADGIGGVLYLADAQCDDYILAPSWARAFISAVYAPPDEGTPLAAAGTPEAIYEFSYQAPQDHIYYALATTSYGTSPPDIKNKVFIDADGNHLGLDLPPGNTTNVWRLTVPSGFVTSAYEALIESMVGAVNSSPFKGRPAGSMRFVQCNSSLTRGGSMSMAWGMQYAANQTGLTVDSISSISKPGHHVLWQLDRREVDNNKQILVPRAVYVQQVFPTADFNQLGF